MLSAEQRLLGSMAIRPLGPKKTLTELVTRVEPRRLVTLARREGVHCLLFANLKRARLIDALPPGLVEELTQRYRRTAALNMQCARDLEQLCAGLAGVGIGALVLKGMALLDELYPDPGLRPTGDVDLWVANEDLDAMTAMLTSIGYTPEPFYPDTYRRGNTIVDIHTHLLGAGRVHARERIFAAGERSLLEGTEPTIYGAAMRKLGTPQNLLFLGLHLMKHNADRLLWLIEINEIVRQCTTDDWERLLEIGEEMGQAISIAHVAYLADLLLPDTVAPRYHELARSGAVTRFHAAVLQRRATHGALPVWGPLLFFSSQRGAWERCTSIFETLFPRPEIIRQIFRDTKTSLWRLYVRRFRQLVASALR